MGCAPSLRTFRVGRKDKVGKCVSGSSVPIEQCAQLRVAECFADEVPGTTALRLRAVAAAFFLLNPCDVAVEFHPGEVRMVKGDLNAHTSAWTGKMLNTAFMCPKAFLSLWQGAKPEVAASAAGTASAAESGDAAGHGAAAASGDGVGGGGATWPQLDTIQPSLAPALTCPT